MLHQKPPAIIIDLDGTLADISHRIHYLKDGKKNWKAFFEEMDKDKLNLWCREIMDKFRQDHKIIILSGRPNNYREKTEKWLKDNSVYYDKLLMRAKNDMRQDMIIKKEIYDNEIKNNFSILFIVDDRMQVVKMWRATGLTCLQCKEGDY